MQTVMVALATNKAIDGVDSLVLIYDSSLGGETG